MDTISTLHSHELLNATALGFIAPSEAENYPTMQMQIDEMSAKTTILATNYKANKLSYSNSTFHCLLATRLTRFHLIPRTYNNNESHSW